MFAKSGDLTSSTADKHNNNFETYMKIRISIGKYPLIIYIFFLLSKGITTEKPDPPSDSEDEDGNETKKPRPPPPPPQKIVKSPPSTKRNSKIPSIKSPTETVKEPEKWIDYRGKYAFLGCALVTNNKSIVH